MWHCHLAQVKKEIFQVEGLAEMSVFDYEVGALRRRPLACKSTSQALDIVTPQLLRDAVVDFHRVFKSKSVFKTSRWNAWGLPDRSSWLRSLVTRWEQDRKGYDFRTGIEGGEHWLRVTRC